MKREPEGYDEPAFGIRKSPPPSTPTSRTAGATCGLSSNGRRTRCSPPTSSPDPASARLAADAPVPTPGQRGVLIRLAAAGVSSGLQFYFYLIGLSVPVIGTDAVQSPALSATRAALHFVGFSLCFYFGFIQRPKRAAA